MHLISFGAQQGFGIVPFIDASTTDPRSASKPTADQRNGKAVAKRMRYPSTQSQTRVEHVGPS